MQNAFIVWSCSLKLWYEPILDGSSGVLAVAHTDHDDGEEEEEAGHGEAHSVHRLVAHDDVTVYLVLQARYGGATHTETWNLTNKKAHKRNIGGRQTGITTGATGQLCGVCKNLFLTFQ